MLNFSIKMLEEPQYFLQYKEFTRLSATRAEVSAHTFSYLAPYLHSIYGLYLSSCILINLIFRLYHILYFYLLMIFGQKFHYLKGLVWFLFLSIFFSFFFSSNELVLFCDLLCQTYYLYFVTHFTLVAKCI